ncbi:hypothetical protein SPAN111604_09630 [Sphingomonas antarctica]|uniref:hypothetical protein n=1 Tax=Sphingomonas antarctica TaxID=2040274 RepID=UPI0039E7EF43
MEERILWRWAAALGVVALLVSQGFGLFHGLAACDPARNSILFFEYARIPADAARIIANDTCRTAQASALWYDGLAFIPAYGSFLILTALAAGGQLRWPTVAAVIVACLCDEVEGLTLGSILAHLPGDASNYAILIPVVRIKFGLLGLASLLIGGTLIRRRTWLILPGAIAIAASALALVSVTADSRMQVMTLAFAIA